MTSTVASIPSKISFNCHDDERDHRASTSEADSASDLTADDDSGSHKLLDAEKEMSDEFSFDIGEAASETEIHPPFPPRTQARKDPDYHADPERSSWTDLDMSLIASVISPVGSWLFGHDHLKNLFVILLLIFYLYQVVEVPWKLYRSSYPRKSSLHIPSAKNAVNHHVLLARSELRSHELFYLALTLISPFFGAILLREVVATVTGDDAMPWFSTNLFVLATGIRPWSHLISRLQQRTRDLHDIIHYPSPELQLIAEGQLAAALHRMENLERELKNIKRVMAVSHNVNQAHEEMLGLMEDMEKIIKRQDRKAESAKLSTEARLMEVEAALLRLESEGQHRDRLPLGSSKLGALMRQLALDVLETPYAIWTTIAVGHFRNTKASLVRGGQEIPDVGRPSSSNIGHLKQVKRNPRLETIPEYDDENIAALAPVNSGLRSSKRRNNWHSDGHSQKRVFSSPAKFLLQLALLPYYLFSRLLIALIPPVQRILP